MRTQGSLPRFTIGARLRVSCRRVPGYLACRKLLSVANVQRAPRCGKNIAPDVLVEIAETDMDKGVVLARCAQVPSAAPRPLAEAQNGRFVTAGSTSGS